MSAPTTGPAVVRFGEFTLDLRSGELTPNGGDRVVLPYQPFRLLAALVRRPAEVITREDLRLELWANDTYVDFEHSLNAAVRRLREALGDSAATPRFIETLPRRGYRFIARVEGDGTPPHHVSPGGAVAAEPTGAHIDTAGESPADLPASRSNSARTLVLGAVAAGLATLGIAGAWWLSARKPAAPPVIAVLPFQNLSVEPDSEYFVDGLTDEIIRNLSVIDGLEVRSRTSSFAFKNKPRHTREVGEALQAGLLLEGSVLREGQKLRINAQLVRVADDVPLWSGRFDRQLEDVFAIQDEISRSIVNELRLKLGRVQRRYNTNVEAYDLFLKAQVLQATGAADTARRAIDLFEQVIVKDPAFAPAHAGLASTYAYLSYLFPFEGGAAVRPEQAEPVMRRAASRALELDPLLADAHAAMGNLYAVDRQWMNAEISFRRALELNPSLTTIHRDFVLTTLFAEQKLNEAMQVLERALRVDPLSLDVRRTLAHVQINAGLYDRAIENCDRVLAVDPAFPFVAAWRVRALVQKGRVSEAVAWLETQGGGAEGYLGYAYAISGRRVEAEALAAANRDYPQRQAMIYAGLGDADRAFDALERLAAVNPRRAGAYLTRPELASIRDDPRMGALRRKLGLPG